MSANGRLEELEKTWLKAKEITEEIKEEIDSQQTQLLDLVTQNVSLANPDLEALKSFAQKPYVIIPRTKNEAYVIVPRFVPFHIGWLTRQTESYNVFIINKYIDWIAPLPHDIKSRVSFTSYLSKSIVVHSKDGKSSILEINPEEFDKTWSKYKDKLHGRVSGSDDQIKIKKGREFDLIADLINDGMLPFEPKPVAQEDLRKDTDIIKLREYQQRALDKFLSYGAIGVFWAPGAGKTFLALKAGNLIKGKKLVVVPQRTLVEQWNERIGLYGLRKYEWEVQTYHYVIRHIDDYQKKQIKLLVFDEVHHLPANNFSKLSTLNTDYRIGLSASPYREDGRTEYIFALSGFPVGLKWRELISLGYVDEPDVKVYLYNTWLQKERDLENVVYGRIGKILIYCDSINIGTRLSNDMGIPFVYGASKNRIETIRNNRIVLASRVADEGLSIKDLDTVIEFDFLYGSRRQEAQRAGRVMHGEGEGEHIVMMTEEEFSKYDKRLFSLEEQGFKIRFERR